MKNFLLSFLPGTTWDSRNIMSFLFNTIPDPNIIYVQSLMLFEGSEVHLMWSFEKEKKGLSYIWKRPNNEKRVKKIPAKCCLFNSKGSLLFYGPFLFFDWFPWRDSNKEVWSVPGWKAEYVKSMDHWGSISILQLNFLAGPLYKWAETFLVTADTSDSRNISVSLKSSKYFTTLNINRETSPEPMALTIPNSLHFIFVHYAF